MGLSTERKVFVGLFIVAAGAFLVDQAFWGPGNAGAGMLDLDLVSDTESAPSVEDAVQSKIEKTAASLLNERLANIGPDSETSSSLNTMFGQPIIQSVRHDSTSEQDKVSPVPVALGLPTLSAVMPASNGGAAVIDGTLIRAGKTSPDGFRLIAVHQRSVTLEKDGKTYSIEVPVTGG